MELQFKGNEIIWNKPLSDLDKLVFKFTNLLERLDVRYVIISGYVAILFGRSRETEDVDIFIEEMPEKKFNQFWNSMEENGFECLNAFSPSEALNDFLGQMVAIRFAEKGRVIPNFEMKYPKTDLNKYSLENRILVKVGENFLYTSKLELQIAFKLYLGSDKDIEDAIHLWQIFKDNIDHKLVTSFAVRLKVESKLKELE